MERRRKGKKKKGKYCQVRKWKVKIIKGGKGDREKSETKKTARKKTICHKI